VKHLVIAFFQGPAIHAARNLSNRSRMRAPSAEK
jgi:hypothetical protein